MKSNLGYATHEYSWFIGQVPPDQNQFVKGATWIESHGNRVKVRIPGKHPKNALIPDEDLPWAIVAKPTSQGNYSGGSIGIWGGEWVLGFFMDESEQVPVITHVLGNNLVDFEITKSKDGSTSFARVNRFNSEMNPNAIQVVGGVKPTSPANVTKEDMPSKSSKSVLLNEQSSKEYESTFKPPVETTSETVTVTDVE